jgi:hypothetical protein
MSKQHMAGLPSAADALSWMRERDFGSGQVLFRGQREVHPTVPPSLLRQDVREEDRRRWWQVLRRFVSSRDGLNGYRIGSAHDAVAIVQHYLVKSPVIDLTGTPEIALYFALQNPSPDKPQVVYAADPDMLKAASLTVSDHAFLALPLNAGGTKHRWLRQDGFTVGLADWTDLDGAGAFDFARLPGVEQFLFRAQPQDAALIADLGDLETVEGDPLAAAVRGMFENIARAMGCLETVRAMMPDCGTIDAQASRAHELRFLAQRAGALGFPSADLAEIERLRRDAEDGRWDTGYTASVEYWTGRVSAAGEAACPSGG